MRHNVHLFVGSVFQPTALALKEYVVKYGENISPYFNVLLLEQNEQHDLMMRRAQSTAATDALDQPTVSYEPPEALAKDDTQRALSDYFSCLFREQVTITNPGDSSTMLLTVFFPLFGAQVAHKLKLVVEAVKRCGSPFEIDLVALSGDLRRAIADSDYADDTDMTAIGGEVFQQVVALRRQHRDVISHLIPMANVNSEGYSLNLNNETLVRLLGEMAIIFVSSYDRFMRRVEDDDNCDVTAIGLSQIYLDEHYFARYLQHKAFLHVLEREQVAQEAVDLNKIAPIAQKCLYDPAIKFDVRNLFSQFWNESKVEIMLAQGKSETEIIALLSPKINNLFETTLPERIQAFIPDENLTLPERKCILALLLGQDDEQFYNDLFDDNQLFVDDVVKEPLSIFVSENNCHKVGDYDENGKQMVTHVVLDKPLNDKKDVYIPLDELRWLKKQIFSSTKYIRTREKELDELASQVKEDKASERRLLPDGYRFNDTIYKLQYGVKEHALQADYVPHNPKADSVDLRKYFSEVRDQGAEGACAAFATVAVYEYFQHRYGIEDNYKMSPAFSYYNARTRDDKAVPGKGSSISDNIEALFELGLCHDDVWKYTVENIDEKPSDEAYADAKSQTVVEALNVKIEEDSDDTLRNMKSALCDGLPVLISLKVYDSFSTTNGIVPHPTEEQMASSDKQGRHALVLCGYSDEHKFFIARNSWGKKFGDKGYCYIPYSYIADSSQCECAFVITAVTPAKKAFVNALPGTKVAFNTTDIAIRRAVITNLVNEEKIYLKRLKRRYDSRRADFEYLFATLCNNRNRTALQGLAIERFAAEVEAVNGMVRAKQDERVNQIEKHRADTRNVCFRTGLIGLGALITAIISFMTDTDGGDYVGYTFSALTLMIVAFIVLYIPYRRARRKMLERELMREINRLTDRRTGLEREQQVLPVKLHLAGAFLEQYNTLRNQLMSKYNCMKAFVGNLNLWLDAEQKSIRNMNSESRLPFVAVLDNATLDEYFTASAKQVTSNIHLADFFNRNYPLTEDGIVQFWHELNEEVKRELMRELDGFTMYKYVLNQEHYPFVGRNVEVAHLLPKLSVRSKTFVPWHQYDAPTPELKYLMLHLENDIEERNWKARTVSYFQSKPQTLSIDSQFKLILVEVKNLRPAEVEMRND